MKLKNLCTQCLPHPFCCSDINKYMKHFQATSIFFYTIKIIFETVIFQNEISFLVLLSPKNQMHDGLFLMETTKHQVLFLKKLVVFPCTIMCLFNVIVSLKNHQNSGFWKYVPRSIFS